MNAKNKAGQTPLDIAVARGHKDIAQLLIDNGAKTSSFMRSLQLRLLLARKDESDGTQETDQDRSGEEPGKEEQKMQDTSDDPKFFSVTGYIRL